MGLADISLYFTKQGLCHSAKAQEISQHAGVHLASKEGERKDRRKRSLDLLECV